MKYIYYCISCNKVFMAGASGKKVKCPKCGQLLKDLTVSDEEYSKLSADEKAILKMTENEILFSKPTEPEPKLENELNSYDVPEPNKVIEENNKNLERLMRSSAQFDSLSSTNKDILASLRNNYLRTQIQNQILASENFISVCKMSALKDDGIIDKEERKLLKNIEKLTTDYSKALNKLLS